MEPPPPTTTGLDHDKNHNMTAEPNVKQKTFAAMWVSDTHNNQQQKRHSDETKVTSATTALSNNSIVQQSAIWKNQQQKSKTMSTQAPPLTEWANK